MGRAMSPQMQLTEHVESRTSESEEGRGDALHRGQLDHRRLSF